MAITFTVDGIEDGGQTLTVCETHTFAVAATVAGEIILATVWSSDGLDGGQGTPTATYSWETTCDHTVEVEVTTTLGVFTETYAVTMSLTLMQIANAIKDTLEASMSAALLIRTYGYDELPEGINDAPSLEVYWQRVICDPTGETDRFTLGPDAIHVKEMTFYVDYIANPRNNLAENNDQLTQGSSEIIDILEGEALSCAGDGHCPPFGLCALKTFHWLGERVAFQYGGVTYYAARFEIVVRTW
jgi:hypothetical protein